MPSATKDSHIQTYKNAQQMRSSNNSKTHSYKHEMIHLIPSNFFVADRRKANPWNYSTHVARHTAAVCNWDHLEESLVKSIFIQGMRERGQANQQKMNNTNTTTSRDNPWFEKMD